MKYEFEPMYCLIMPSGTPWIPSINVTRFGSREKAEGYFGMDTRELRAAGYVVRKVSVTVERKRK